MLLCSAERHFIPTCTIYASVFCACRKDCEYFFDIENKTAADKKQRSWLVGKRKAINYMQRRVASRAGQQTSLLTLCRTHRSDLWSTKLLVNNILLSININPRLSPTEKEKILLSHLECDVQTFLLKMLKNMHLRTCWVEKRVLQNQRFDFLYIN